MPTPPAGFAQVEVNYNMPTAGLKDAMVTFGIQAASYDVTLAEALKGIWTDNWLAVLHSHAGVYSVTVRDSASGVFESSSAELAGTAGDTISPPQVALMVQKRTGVGGRRNRGRMYLPGPREDGYTDEGQLTTAQASELQTAADDWLTDMGNADVGVVILHADGGTPTDVTSLVAGTFIATQRRRLKRQ